jgi:hypothetical protein
MKEVNYYSDEFKKRVVDEANKNITVFPSPIWGKA